MQNFMLISYLLFIWYSFR